MTRSAGDPGRVLLIGSGGLLGRHLRAALEASGANVHTASVPWTDPDASVRALRRSLAAFLDPPETGTRPWSIVWAAGAGVVATPEPVLAAEGGVFAAFMADLARRAPRRAGIASRALGRPGGAVLLLSSAGGVYAGCASAGCAQAPFTEATVPHPLAPYGWVKLRMEEAAAAACHEAGLPLLVARLANAYGPGQRLDKPQGLVSQIALSHVSGRPLTVTVGQDTIRDYVYAPDAAALSVLALGRLHAARPGVPVVKIVATGLGVTVGHLVSEARRVLHRPLRTVLVAGRGGGQVPDLRLRSTVWPELDGVLRTPLPAGLAATVQDVRERVVAGRPLAR